MVIKIGMDFYVIKKLDNYTYYNKLPLPSKFKIIIEHINFLIFPYIIEYLSFSYYIYFFPNKFIITINNENEKILLIINVIINTILIILYNIDNYLGMICSNKKFTITIFEANSEQKKDKNEKNNNKFIAYRCSNIELYIVIILQNFILFLTFDNYINKKYKIIFKIIISVLLFLSILILFINKINKYNYLNFINTSINILFFLCFYSIIFDLIIFIIKYRVKKEINQIIYLLFKLFFSYISHLLLIKKTHNFLGDKIAEILFKEKNDKKEKEKYFLNSFYLLHQIMIKIFEENEIELIFLLFKYLNKHINKCNKTGCNCILIQTFINKNSNNIIHKGELKSDMSILLIIFNYLFENAFLEYNFYNNYDLTILLAEHFCHLKHNPTMSFSIISTLILKQRNKLSIIQMSVLYELNQKYIYYISSKIKDDIEKEIIIDKIEALKNKIIEDEFKSYYYNFILSNRIKKILSNYIDNISKILQYKSIFEDSLLFQFDENNESINSVQINFFKQNIKIDGLYDSPYNKNKYKKNKVNKNSYSNLYNIIYLLNKEKVYYQEVIDNVNQIQILKSMPIFMIFKYFLFFDFFNGGKIPDIILKKLYSCLYNNISSYSQLITKKEYLVLRKRYEEQNNQLNSKVYVIVEFKKELRTKYFTEDGALKLGFKQKDIINEKIDLLMPSEFCKSHHNAIKQLIIGSQIRYSISKQSYYFNRNNTRLYSSNFGGSLIYSISKSFFMILESNFNFENEYRFMLDNNFELLANSRNFEDEYYLNKKILQAYNIKILDILKIKQENLIKKFEKEYKKIQEQNLIRQAKIHEYFIPELYLPPGDKISGIKNRNNNNWKNNILSKLLNSKKNQNMDNKDEEEKENLVQNKNIKSAIKDLFNHPREIVFHKTYNMILNKGTFIENLAKELVKIPDNDLMMENDKNHYNLVLATKQLISKLLTKSELSNHYMLITIKFSYFYDKPFYFITIDDKKKSYLKLKNYIHFENYNNNQLISVAESQSIKNMNTLFNNNDNNKKSKNIDMINKKNKSKNIQKDKKVSFSRNKSNSIQTNFRKKKENNENLRILNIINEYKKDINKVKFISIIKSILSIIIIFILMIYILIIILQMKIIKRMDLILLAYYYNLFTKNLLLGIHSILLNIYYDSFLLGLSNNNINNNFILNSLTHNLKEKYHNFTDYFYDYNLQIGHDFNIIYQKRNFSKLRGYWQEIQYESKYSSELDYVIYNILSFNIADLEKDENKIDFKNFLFFQDRTKTHEKVNCVFVKLIYYLSVNYEFVFKDLLKEIEIIIYDSYKQYVSTNLTSYFLLEILGLVLYFIFYITVFSYLYFSNNIIIKNIIFLFLDFSEECFNKTKFNNSNNMISLKLKEIQYIIDDFDMILFEQYSKRINDLNKDKTIILKNDDTNNTYNNNDNADNNENISKPESNSHNNSESLNQLSLRKKLRKNSSKNILDSMNNSNKTNLLFEMKNKLMNNSSQNSNSQLLKDKLNNNSMNASKDLLTNKNDERINNSKNNVFKLNIGINKVENEDQKDIKDQILNNSNKDIVLMIKIHFIIELIFIIIVILFFSYKFQYISSFSTKFNRYFVDLPVLTDRYMQVYYYFNTLRTLIIFPDGERKKKLEDIMENMNEQIEKENIKYNDILLNNMKDYKETNKLFDIIRNSQNNMTNIIKETICKDEEACRLYLESDFNIFDSGVDFAFKTSLTQGINLYMDYKNLNNKYDIQEIIDKLFVSSNDFYYIMVSLNYFYVYIEQRIFLSFELDETDFKNTYVNNITFLNIISIIFSISMFLIIIIYVFISISNFTEPIKESTYRINCSLYYIKKYNLNTY